MEPARTPPPTSGPSALTDVFQRRAEKLAPPPGEAQSSKGGQQGLGPRPGLRAATLHRPTLAALMTRDPPQGKEAPPPRTRPSAVPSVSAPSMGA